MDERNAGLVNDETKAAIEQTKQKIISGEIEVHDTDDSCPV